MTASVADLLAGVDRAVFDLLGSDLDRDRLAGVLAAWPQLAAETTRVLQVLPVAPDAATSSVLAGLRMVASSRQQALVGLGGAVPDAEVGQVTMRLGAVADLLVGTPRAFVDAEVDAAWRLRAGVLAPVFALAHLTAASLERVGGPREPQWAFRALAAQTERFALVPPAQRAGRYDDLAAIPADEQSLDAAITGWSRATVPALTGRHALTGTALQTAAGDALILIAAATATVPAAVEAGVVDAAQGVAAASALGSALEGWRSPARWPAGVRLDGARSLDQWDASRRLRSAVGDVLRDGNGWLPAAALVERVDVGRLVSTMRRGMHAVTNVALAHFQAIDTLVRGRGQLWASRSAITDRRLRASAVLEAGNRDAWLLLPPGEPTAVRMVAAAEHVLVMTSRAMAALDRTASSRQTTGAEPTLAFRLDQGRLAAEFVGPPERVEPHRTPWAERRALPRPAVSRDVPRP